MKSFTFDKMNKEKIDECICNINTVKNDINALLVEKYTLTQKF
jgi:hypothetical protein